MEGNWTVFHQKEELTTRIKNILNDYPPGIGPFKEFLQNADDAGARSFAIMFDSCTYGKEKLLGKGLEAWQGPALLIYNSATFTDNDLENITRLGKSEKFEDNTRIGKYGLGFNVSYHFTDVVSFISRDQFIIFDPHCKYLPQNCPGLRINFMEEKLTKTFPDQVESFVKNEATFGCSLQSEFSGTLFRLPLRKAALAKESIMSNIHYNSKEILSLLVSFAKAASSMLLFVKNIENISIYYKKPSGEVQTVFVVNVKNIDKEIRRKRCLLKDYSKNIINSPSVRSSFTLVLSESDGKTEKATSTWLVHSGSNSGSEDLQKQKNQIQWGGVSACISSNFPNPQTQHEGRAYCFLPLPIKTGLPLHVNGDFALSSNRRDLWHDDDVGGDGVVKGEWNKELIENLLVVLYAEMLEIYQKSCNPENSYDFWPDINQTIAPFHELSLYLMQDIVKQKRKLFWVHLKKQYLPFDQVLIETNASKKYLHPNIRQALSEAGMNLVDPPEFVKTTLEAAKVPLIQVTPEIVAKVLKEKNIELTWQQGDELLDYILHNWEPGHSSTNVNLTLLDGIKCLPLINNQLGVLQIAMKKDNEYYTGQPEVYTILENFPKFIDLSSSVYYKLHHPDTAKVINVSQITIETISMNMQYLLPQRWFGRSIVQVSDNVSGSWIDSSNEEAEKKKNEINVAQDSEWIETCSLRKKHRGKQKHSKPQPPTIPEQSVEPENLQKIFKKLDFFWDFVDKTYRSLNLKEMFNLNKWPLVRLHQGYLVSISYAQQRIVLLDIAFDNQETTLLQQLGCLFANCQGRDRTLAYSRFFGKTKVDACLAISNSLRPPPSTEAEPDITLIQELRELVVVWHMISPLEPSSIKALPLYLTMQGKYVTLLEKAFAAPSEFGPYHSDSKWDRMLTPIFPERLLCVSDQLTVKLLQIAQNPRLEVIYFIENILFNEIERLPRPICVEILSTFGTHFNKVDFDERWESLPIVVLDDGTRHPCKEFLDPSEAALLESLPNFLGTCPPVEYHHPRILKVMRSAGMMSLKVDKGFLKAAHAIAEKQLITGAEILMELLVKFHQDSQFVWWPKDAYRELIQIPFVPCFNFKPLTFPPAHLVELPIYKETPTPKDRNFNLLKKKWKKLDKAVYNNSFEEEFDYYDDVDNVVDDISVPDCYSTASELLSEWFVKERSNKPKNPLPQKVLQKFSDGVCLNMDLWLSWKVNFILPSSFNRAPQKLLTNLHIYPLKIPTIISQLRGTISTWFTSKPPDPRPLQAVILLSFLSINRALRSKPRDMSILQRHLKNIPVVLYDNGEFVTCDKVVVDLECDLSMEARAAPLYLRDFPKILQLIGSPSIDTPEDFSGIVSAGKNPISGDFFSRNVLQLFNNPWMSDVLFECSEGRNFHGHKLILSLSSQVFKKMFSGGFLESSGTSVIRLPDENPESVSTFLYYFYTGKIPQDTWYPVTQDTVNMTIRLLSLSDQYMVPFLKESCEVYLSDPVVLTLRNVVDLLVVANMFRALQLKELCVRKIWRIIDVVVQMPEWRDLPEEMKKDILEKNSSKTK